MDVEVLLTILTTIGVFLFVIWVLFSVLDLAMEGSLKECEDVNIFKLSADLLLYVIHLPLLLVAVLKPKSGIDREIAQKKKEIGQLELHKEKMAELKRLEQKERALFEELNSEEVRK